MRQNKGYQKNKKRDWKSSKEQNAYASGNNKTLEQYLSDIDKHFDKRIEAAKKSYSRINNQKKLKGETLRNYCKEWLLWEVRFDDNGSLIPLEIVLADLERKREREKNKDKYDYRKRIVNKDNQRFVYNSGGGASGSRNRVRIPSIKRSNSVWRNFYELFPYYREHYGELNNRNGIKLKKIW